MEHRKDHPPATATLEGARAHAREQADAIAATRPTVPSTAAIDLPAGIAAESVVWDETLPVGGYVARRLRRGTTLRLEDTDGDGSVAMLVFRADNPAERLNVADTVKVQWQAYLGPDALLLSDMGRALMTIVHDTSARHDCLCGTTNRAGNAARYGSGSASGPTPNGRDLLALGAAKLGLARVDVHPNLTLFKGVRVGPDGGLALEGDVRPGTAVHLRADLDVAVVLANTPHPLDERDGYEGTTVRCTAWRGDDPADAPVAVGEPAVTTPERLRAYQNTAELLAVEVR